MYMCYTVPFVCTPGLEISGYLSLFARGDKVLDRVNGFSDWEGKGPCAIVPLTWKMANQSLCRMIRNGPLKISKSMKKAENDPLKKISSLSLWVNRFCQRLPV